MTYFFKKLEHFEEGRQITSEKKGKNPLAITKKIRLINISTCQEKKYYANWYLKKLTSLKAVLHETIAQELLRLFDPYVGIMSDELLQPKTRVCLGAKHENFYIVSKKINDFRLLSEIPAKEFVLDYLDKKNIYGFAYVSVMGLFLNMMDMRLANLGMVEKYIDGKIIKRMIKLDGEFSFGNLWRDQYPVFSSARYKITKKMVDMLPQPVGYAAYNWLDYIVGNVCRSANYASDKIVIDGRYNQEKREAMARIIFFPDAQFAKFVAAYTAIPRFSHDAEKIGRAIVHELHLHKKQMVLIALQDQAFVEWVKSPAGEDYVTKLHEQLNLFFLPKKQKLDVAKEALLRELAYIRTLLPEKKGRFTISTVIEEPPEALSFLPNNTQVKIGRFEISDVTGSVTVAKKLDNPKLVFFMRGTDAPVAKLRAHDSSAPDETRRLSRLKH